MNYEHKYITYETPETASFPLPLIMRTARHDHLPTMTSVITDEAVTIGLEIQAHGGFLQATGAAKRHPKDTPNSEIGLALAQARAFRAAAEELERITNERVQRIDREEYSKRALQRMQEKINETMAKMEFQTQREFLDQEDLDADPDILLVDEEDEDSWKETPATDLLVHPVVYGRAAAGVRDWAYLWTIGELDVYSEEELTEFEGVGPATAKRIREAIDKLKKSKK